MILHSETMRFKACWDYIFRNLRHVPEILPGIAIIMANIYYTVHLHKYTRSYPYLQAFILIDTKNRQQI